MTALDLFVPVGVGVLEIVELAVLVELVELVELQDDIADSACCLRSPLKQAKQLREMTKY